MASNRECAVDIATIRKNSRAISYKTAINWCHQIPLRKPGTVRKAAEAAAPLQVQDQIVHISVPIGFINLGAFQNDLRQPAVHQLHTRQTAGSHYIDQHAHRVNIRFGSGLVKAELLRRGKALGAQDLRIAVLIALDGAANAKVDDLHRAVRRQHNIVWVNIPVNNAQLVHLLQPITDLERYILGFKSLSGPRRSIYSRRVLPPLMNSSTA